MNNAPVKHIVRGRRTLKIGRDTQKNGGNRFIEFVIALAGNCITFVKFDPLVSMEIEPVIDRYTSHLTLTAIYYKTLKIRFIMGNGKRVTFSVT